LVVQVEVVVVEVPHTVLGVVVVVVANNYKVPVQVPV
jgi:hypothetical protein